ncbi:MAG TPA: enoyl-CoA hydratase/isomerase family protein [Thermoanaerobaculia bacterium]|nr:enoyl-CoA hydratase/isomerase family protein [Thermoanaerobaculia bacterium]
MIELTRTDNLLTIRLAHGKASALDIELMDALALAVAEASESDAAAVILTGTGSIFSAGVDLYRLTEGGREYCERFVPALSRFVLELFTFPKPLVVAVNGHAIAGGCIMTLCGDYRLMSGGRIGAPELLVGVPFPAAILEIVRFAVPPQHLQSLIYTGRTLSPDDALRFGLVDEVTDALPARAEEIARQLAAINPKIFAQTKRQLRDKTVSRAKHYANEFDDDVRELWSDPATHAHIREYLAKTVRK